ncbi:MAG: Crp/Fnr family transcriptional regulator [Methylococcales bacterium]|nr:Crp/Fnr family transcriptional regulator [Methylococcales bacterium]
MLKHKELWETCFPEFIQCGESTIMSLMESATLANIPAGQQVFASGSRCENYLLLLKGSVKAQLISENGREMLLYQVLPGDSCVLTTSCLLSGDQYPAEAFAEEDVSAFIISSHAFYRCLEQSAFFREFVFKNFAARLSLVIGRLGETVFEGIEWRLAKELLSADTKILHVTHQELAIKLGSAREVISRNLKQFETKGWVNLNRGTVTITNIDALKKLTISNVRH